MKLLSAILFVLLVSVLAVPAGAREKKAEAKVALPEVVAKAVTDNFPGAVIDNIEAEKKAGINLYVIEFKAESGEIEIAEDGTVIEVTTTVEMKDVPLAAAEVIQNAAKDATIKELEKSETRAEIKTEGTSGRIVRLDSPSFAYEVELVKGGKRGEIQVAPDGKIVEALKWKSRGAKKD